jgi:molybdate transport system substrate-binding protein
VKYLLSLVLLLAGPLAAADTLSLAVASNFSSTARVLAERFEAESGHRLRLAYGATGKHYAQIRHGAPFDLFLAADAERPRRLEAEGNAVAGSRFTYAIGQLALWSPQAGLVDPDGQVLSAGDFRHLAIANPRLAPYGLAARQVLERLQLWQGLQSRLVLGENIGQAFRFVHSGAAELGFVALSQIMAGGRPIGGSHWRVPTAMYDPIEQQAVMLRDSPASRGFLDYLRSEPARAIIRAHGYQTP